MMIEHRPEDWFYHPHSRLWWSSRYRRWFTQDGSAVEWLTEPVVVAGPVSSELDRIHLNWEIGVVVQRHGEQVCQTAMQELIMESLEPPRALGNEP